MGAKVMRLGEVQATKANFKANGGMVPDGFGSCHNIRKGDQRFPDTCMALKNESGTCIHMRIPISELANWKGGDMSHLDIRCGNNEVVETSKPYVPANLSKNELIKGSIPESIRGDIACGHGCC